MKALVTGSNGFVGRHLCARLKTEGWVVDEQPHMFESPGLLIHNPDVIFHLGARVRNSRSITDPPGTMDSNVMGSVNIFALAQAMRIPVVYASSAVVYSPIVTPYQISKIAADSLAQFYNAHGGDIRIMRLAEVYGPGMRNGPIATWREQYRKHSVIDVWEGLQKKDYIYVSDAVNALMNTPLMRKGVYDLCSGVQTDLIDLAKLLDVPIQMVKPQTKVAPFLPQSPSPGCKATVSLEDGMAEVRKEFHDTIL